MGVARISESPAPPRNFGTSVPGPLSTRNVQRTFQSETNEARVVSESCYVGIEVIELSMQMR
jgi:hypothetical protein